MLSIKPKTAFTNISESGLPPTAINDHFDLYTKTIISEPPAILYKTVSFSMTRVTHFQTLSFYFLMNSCYM